MVTRLNRQAFWGNLRIFAIYSLKIFDESEKLKHATDKGFEDMLKITLYF